MNEILEENKNMIYALASSFKNYNNKEDLFQVGCIGLINAYNRFDSSMGVKFSTYAYTYILGEMKKLARDDKGIKISREITKLNYKIEQVKNVLEQKLLREPTTKEIADFMEIDEYYIYEAQNSINCLDSFDSPIKSDSKEISLYDLIGENMNIDTMIEIKTQLEKLDDIEKQIILSRYMEDLTQQQTAQKLGMNQVQVSRQESKVLSKLKRKLMV